MRQQGAPAPKQPAPAAGAPERGGFPGAARVMAPRQQPAKGAACPRPPGQAAGAGPNGQPVGHGRRPLTGACACALAEGCRRVRLRTGGALARGRGIFKQGRKERRRRRLRRAGGLHGGTVSRWRQRHRRPARIARRPGLQRAAVSPARCSRRTPARSPAGGGVTGARLASHAGQVSSGRRRLRRAARIARRHGRRGAGAAPARCSRHAGASSPCGPKSRSGAALAGQLSQITRARGVCATVGIAATAQGSQCQKGSRLVVYQVFWRWLVGETNPVAPPGARGVHRALPASVGRCCARPGQRGRWPRAKSGRCRRTGKRAIQGAALAGRRRVVGAVLLGGGGAAVRSRASGGKRSIAGTLGATVPTRNRTPAAPGAFVAVGVRCKKWSGGMPNKASEGERVRRHSLHFL